MSTVYNTEPPTNGKVILKTSLGDVDLELWPKEAPKAVRNFVQLCLEGYYDGCSFFRLIKDLFAQTGDPGNTGRGGESIYGGNFPDEFHSRLRFTHRGLVAMANASQPNSNGSQFFITLSDCEWLNNKHTIFGRISGDTIYNVLQMNELEVNGEVPVYPPKILSTQVLHCPFDDIIPRQIARSDQSKPKSSQKTERKKLKKKNTSLLSFGEEAEEEDKELDAVLASGTSSRGVASSHDLLDDSTLLKDAADEVLNSQLRETNEANAREEQRQKAAKQKLKTAAANAASGSNAHSSVDDDVEEALAEGEDGATLEANTVQVDMSFDERMRQKLKAKQVTLNSSVDEQAKIDELKEKMGFKSAKGGSSGPRKGEKAARRNLGGDVDDSGKRKAEEAFMSPLEVMREKYKRKKASNTSRQQETLAKLASFKSIFGDTVTKQGKPDERDGSPVSLHDTADTADADAERLRVAAADDLEAERGVSWSSLLKNGGGLKFEKSIEEKRAEISRDDNYKVLDPLAKRGGKGGDVDIRKSQHRRRLQGDDSDRGRGGRRPEKW